MYFQFIYSIKYKLNNFCNEIVWLDLVWQPHCIFFFWGGGEGGEGDVTVRPWVWSPQIAQFLEIQGPRLGCHYCYHLVTYLNYPKTKSQQDSLRLKFWSLEDVSVKVFISLRLPKTISRVFKRGRIGFTIFYHQQL